VGDMSEQGGRCMFHAVSIAGDAVRSWQQLFRRRFHLEALVDLI
jgi:hypothetical protein